MMRDRPRRSRMSSSLPASPRWYALPLLLLGVVGFAALWVLVALSYDRMLAWLAPLAAADMVLLLAVARWPAGGTRAALAVLATATTIALANFWIAAGQVGQGLGLLPWQSALKLGPAYAWTLSELATSALDLAWYALALAVAAWAGLSARRPAPSAR
jgi:hypothetical protein